MPEINFELIRYGLPVIVMLLCAGCWMAGYSAGANSATPEAIGSESDDLTIAYMAGVSRGKEITRTRMTSKEIMDMPVTNWNNPVLVARAVEDFHHITETKQ